jgi:hypothetical protein
MPIDFYFIFVGLGVEVLVQLLMAKVKTIPQSILITSIIIVGCVFIGVGVAGLVSVIVGGIVGFCSFLIMLHLMGITRLKDYWHSFQNWRYLRKYGTEYEIYQKGKLQIENLPQDQGYNMILEFSLKCTNRDNLNKLMIDCKDILVNINSEKVSGQKTHYPLTYVYGLVGAVYGINPRKAEIIPYKVRCWNQFKPWLGSTCRCYIKTLGNCRLSPASKRLMHKPFSVDVDWSKIETPAPHKEGSQK